MSEESDKPGAPEDLARGLGLMFRAAKKAVKGLDLEKVEERIEDFGRRAASSLDDVDRGKVEDFGRKAVRSLDPKKIEQFAEDAGREFLGVVNRVTEKLESVVAEGVAASNEPEGNRDKPAASAEPATTAATDSTEESETVDKAADEIEEEKPPRRIRVSNDDD